MLTNTQVFPGPTEVDLLRKEKADFVKDTNSLMTNEVFTDPENEEADKKVYDGMPEIRTTSRNTQVASNPAKQNPVSVNQSSITKEQFKQSLNDSEKALFESYLVLESSLPEGMDAIKLMEAKRKHKNLFAIELPSGLYIFKSLTSAEDKRIKKIANLTQGGYANHVVSTCLISPVMDLMQVEETQLAGTKATLLDSILVNSDFQTNETVAFKL